MVNALPDASQSNVAGEEAPSFLDINWTMLAVMALLASVCLRLICWAVISWWIARTTPSAPRSTPAVRKPSEISLPKECEEEVLDVLPSPVSAIENRGQTLEGAGFFVRAMCCPLHAIVWTESTILIAAFLCQQAHWLNSELLYWNFEASRLLLWLECEFFLMNAVVMVTGATLQPIIPQSMSRRKFIIVCSCILLALYARYRFDRPWFDLNGSTITDDLKPLMLTAASIAFLNGITATAEIGRALEPLARWGLLKLHDASDPVGVEILESGSHCVNAPALIRSLLASSSYAVCCFFGDWAAVAILPPLLIVSCNERDWLMRWSGLEDPLAQSEILRALRVQVLPYAVLVVLSTLQRHATRLGLDLSWSNEHDVLSLVPKTGRFFPVTYLAFLFGAVSWNILSWRKPPPLWLKRHAEHTNARAKSLLAAYQAAKDTQSQRSSN